MKSSRILATAALMLVSVAVATPAIGGAEFLAYGYAMSTGHVVGSSMEVYGILDDVGDFDDPIAMDWDNVQYTVYVTPIPVESVMDLGSLILETCGGAVVTIYADPIATGTAADYGDLSTFVDGTVILTATLAPGFTTMLNDTAPTGDGLYGGSGSGLDLLTFDGGSRLGDLSAAEYYLNGWNFLGSPIEDELTNVPDGFNQIFNVKITPSHDPTPTTGSTWGDLRNLYR